MELLKIFSHFMGCCFVLLTVSFTFQKLFSFTWLHLLIFSLSTRSVGKKLFIFMWFHLLIFYLLLLNLLTFCVWIFLLCQCIICYSSLSFLSDSVFLVLYWGLSWTWTWVLCSVTDMDLILLHTDILLDQPTMFWRCFLFVHFIFLTSLWKIRSQVCGFTSGYSIWFHWSTCVVFMWTTCVFLITISL